MSEIAFECAVVAVTLHDWREMFAHQNMRRGIIKTMCPGLTVSANLQHYILDVLTAEDLPHEGFSVAPDIDAVMSA